MFSDISHLHVSILKSIVTLLFSKPQTRKLNALPTNNLYLALSHCAPTGKGFKPITGILASVVKWFPSRWVWPQTIWCCHHCPLSLPKRWCTRCPAGPAGQAHRHRLCQRNSNWPPGSLGSTADNPKMWPQRWPIYETSYDCGLRVQMCAESR